MICANCKALLADGAETCHNCGIEIRESLPSPGLDVLIVEDHEDFADFLRECIESAGLRCQVEFNGKDGLQRFKSDHFDIAVIDVDIPFIDGITLTRIIKSQNEDFPVILYSGYLELLTAEDIKSSMADAFMTKPIKMESLYLELQKLTIGAPEAD